MRELTAAGKSTAPDSLPLKTGRHLCPPAFQSVLPDRKDDQACRVARRTAQHESPTAATVLRQGKHNVAQGCFDTPKLNHPVVNNPISISMNIGVDVRPRVEHRCRCRYHTIEVDIDVGNARGTSMTTPTICNRC